MTMTNSRHIASLDGLRGLAAIMVVLSHITTIYPHLNFPVSGEIGSDAVALFFALSGFLMAAIYGHRPLTLESGLGFLVSRFARIYPVYIVAILFVLLLSKISSLGYIEPMGGEVSVIRHVLMMGSSGVFWSVPPEIQFYLVFPLIWFCLANPVRLQAMLYSVLGLLVVLGLLDFPGPGILLISKLHFFMAGVVAGYLHHRSEGTRGTLLHGITALVGFVMLFTYQTLLPALDVPSWGMPTALAAALIVSAAAREHPLSARVFAAAPLRFAGTISFSLYLFHKPVMFLTALAMNGKVPDWVSLALSLVAALVVATLVNRLWEAPARQAITARWNRRKARLARRLIPQA